MEGVDGCQLVTALEEGRQTHMNGGDCVCHFQERRGGKEETDRG